MSKKKGFRGSALGLVIITVFPGLFIALFLFAEQHFANLPYYGPYEIVTTTVNGETVQDTVYTKVIDFSFETAAGGVVSDESLQGNIYVAEFFHVESRIRLLEDKFDSEDDVKFVSHTVDEDMNTVQYLSDYATVIKADTARWYFAVAPVEELFDVATNGYFHGMTSPDTIQDMLINHNVFVLVDKEGFVRGIYDGGLDNEALVSEVKRVEEEIRLLKKHYDKADAE